MANKKPHRFRPGNNANPNGRPKGAKNKLNADVKSAIEMALELAGQRIQSDDKTLDGIPASAAYMLSIAEKHPAIFAGLIKPLLPAKLEIDVNVLGPEMLNLLSERRDQVSQMKTIEHEDDDGV